jgi:hypothetical protein
MLSHHSGLTSILLAGVVAPDMAGLLTRPR